MSAIGHGELLPKEKLLPSIGTFLLFLVIFATVGYALVIEIGMRRYYMAILMWSPALAVFATCKLQGISISSLGWKWGESKWHWFAYGLPIAYGLVAYGILWGAGLGGVPSPKYINWVGEFLGLHGWSDTQVLLFAVLMFGVVSMIWHIGASLGEELGWRGFLTPQLMRLFSFPVTSLIVGLIWSAWHAPLIYLTDYNAGPYDLHMQMFNFTVAYISLSFILTYLRLKSGSVWTATLLHASHNAYVISIYGEMTIKYDQSSRYMGEFGVILPAVLAVLAGYFWYKARREGLTGPLNN